MDDIYSKAVRHFGIDNQRIKAIEELSELQRELCRWQNNDFNSNLYMEMADVLIMMKQMIAYLGEPGRKGFEMAMKLKLRNLETLLKRS